MLEELIAQHCSPALAGIKPANLVSCFKNKIPDLQTEILRLNKELNPQGIFLENICECDKRILLLVYRKKQLTDYLSKLEISELLKHCGYSSINLLDCIKTLKKRMLNTDFPHEIGAFLGYPAHDIYGFINHKTCLLVGDWRVYENADEAKKIFARYKICRCAVMKKVSQGKKLSQIFCTAKHNIA